MWFVLCFLVVAVPSLLAVKVDEKYLETVMKRELPKEGLAVERVKLIKMSSFDTVGTVFGSNRTRAEMEITLTSGQTKKKSVVIVDIPKDHRANLISQLGLFEREIDVYNHVLPMMDNYLMKFRDDYLHNKIWLKAYDMQEYTSLIVEDVAFLDYHPQKSYQGLDMKHSKVAMEALAKFHALGAVLKQKNIIDMKRYDLSVGQKTKDSRTSWTAKVFKEFAKSIRSHWGTEWESAAKFFDEKSKTISHELLNLFKRDEAKLNTLLSGYFYIDNNYFKYDSKKNPIDVKTMVFQNAFYNSPAFDLQMFLNTSPEPELLIDEARREDLVHFYAQKLVEYLKKFGYDKKFTADEFYAEDRRTELLGLTNAIVFLGEIYQKDAHLQVTDEYFIDGTKGRENNIHNKGMSNPTFIKVMKGLVTIARKHGTITY